MAKRDKDYAHGSNKRGGRIRPVGVIDHRGLDDLFADKVGLNKEFEGLQELYEIRLRPNDGTPRDQIGRDDYEKHLLLTDRKTQKQYRVRSSHNIPKGVAADGDGKGPMVNMDLYEVFEGDKYAPENLTPKLGLPADRFKRKPKVVQQGFLNAAYERILTEPTFKPYRNAITKAVPFALTPQATEHVTLLSSDKSKCELYRSLARLPYDTVWLELDPKSRVNVQLGYNGREDPYERGKDPDHIGYLLERLSETRWRTTTFISTLVTQELVDTNLNRVPPIGQEEVGTQMLEVLPPHFILDTEGTVTGFTTQARDPSLHHHLNEMLQDDLWAGIGWGLIIHKDGKRIPMLRPSLVGSATVDLPLDWEAYLLREHLRPHERRDAMVRILSESAAEQSGILRWLTAALATINEVPTIITESKPHGSFRADGRLRPYKVNRVVQIDLKGKHVPKKMISLFRGAKRRMARHQVRGFWRTMEGSNRPGGRWVWKYSMRHSEHRWSIWITDFERGDASLGYVLHKYEVKAGATDKPKTEHQPTPLAEVPPEEAELFQD